MRLLTHNLLVCNRKQCTGGFPLQIKISDSEDAVRREDAGSYNPEFVKNLLNKLSWDALRETAERLSLPLPLAYTEDDLNDENFLTLVYDTVINFHILEGELVCPKCQRVFPISKGIPNMLLHDDEV